jgi:amino acid transporter
MENKGSPFTKVKNVVIGKAKDIHDAGLFHKLSLVAFFAWIGIGADGLSSSCYGPQESYLALNGHSYLSIFVAIGTMLTIFIISASYSQIVELFPASGGGYVVASKLLSPTVGMISGCALMIDYVLTITVSVASGADAVFSLLAPQWHSYRLIFAVSVLIVLIILNMRGLKESVFMLAPIFVIFIITHVFIILYGLLTHLSGFNQIVTSTASDISSAASQIGIFGIIILILRSYSMGAGTYTGIEAVSNSMSALREPREETAKKTMRYMAASLAFIVIGLALSYLLYNVRPAAGKTLNTVFFENATSTWNPNLAYIFILITLVSEAALLFAAAQTGFIGGPRVLANMALDRWFPTRFATLSDRLVAQNGILIIGVIALAMMIFTGGSVRFLIVLYSINVFITFVLSQLGMVRHWWQDRANVKGWFGKLAINGIGLILCAFILISMIVIKFNDGGWITLLITTMLVAISISIKRHYISVAKLLRRLNPLVAAATRYPNADPIPDSPERTDITKLPDPETKTAILLVNGFNGMGLHVLFNVMRLFGGAFKNFVFIEVGVIDTGNFKGRGEIENLKTEVEKNVNSYVDFMHKHGYYAEGIGSVGVNVVDEVASMAPAIVERFPNSVFFGGQLVFEKDTLLSKVFHNYTVFTVQKRLYRENIPFVILPVRV